MTRRGADFSWTMHDCGLPLDRIPDTIARIVQLIVEDLQAAAAERGLADAPYGQSSSLRHVAG